MLRPKPWPPALAWKLLPTPEPMFLPRLELTFLPRLELKFLQRLELKFLPTLGRMLLQARPLREDAARVSPPLRKASRARPVAHARGRGRGA